MSEVGLLAAFAAGVLALLSPCSALLLPSFFAYAFATRIALVLRTAGLLRRSAADAGAPGHRGAAAPRRCSTATASC